MSKISPEDTISDVLSKHPNAEKVIDKYFQSMCLHCPMATMETIEDGARSHGIDAKEVVAEINKVISKGASRK